MFALIKYASELFQYNNLSPPEWLLHLFCSLEVMGSIPELCWFFAILAFLHVSVQRGAGKMRGLPRMQFNCSLIAASRVSESSLGTEHA